MPLDPPDPAPRGAAARCVPEARSLPPHLARWLAAAGITGAEDPLAAWCRLREAEGRRVTGLDLYWLAARRRGLAAHELPRADRARLALSVMPLLAPGFVSVNDAERGREPVEVVPYDPDWTRRFATWRDRLAAALGPAAVRIEHVGSTSVPGLAAKPVIDIQISVPDVGDESRYVRPLEAAGMQMRSRDDVHRFFRPFPDQPRDAHLHLCEPGSDWEREHLLFRDYLRAHPAACERYHQGKSAAARTWRDDRWAYTEAKTGVILDILADAERWARDTTWSPSPHTG